MAQRQHFRAHGRGGFVDLAAENVGFLVEVLADVGAGILVVRLRRVGSQALEAPQDVGFQIHANPEAFDGLAEFALAAGKILQLAFQLDAVGGPRVGADIQIRQIPAVVLGFCGNAEERRQREYSYR